MRIKEKITSLIYIIFGWIVIFPLSLLVPRKKGLIISIGRSGSDFTDNTKYFHLYLVENHDKNKAFFISDSKRLDKNIPNYVKHTTLSSVWLLLRADFVIVDYSMWFENFKYHLSIKAKKIQLWHGIGSKRIELDADIFQKSKFKKLKILYGKLRGQLIKYHLFLSTSDYYSNGTFKTSFFYKEIKPLGMPRNDVLFRELTNNDLIGTDKNIIEIIKKKKKEGFKVVLYTPTYRIHSKKAFLNNNKLNEFAKSNNIIFVIKHHPITKIANQNNFENVFVYNSKKDIYPLMNLSDLMITDYSSIYLDFIILNKPILFYIPDFYEYQEQEIKLRNDFLEITPGEKINNQKELENSIKNILFNNIDNYKQKRTEIINFSYKYKDGKSCERIYNYIIKNKK
ncbi:MAG: hypothetical protein GXO49_04285 [Chlorobi bacterium]|nr:hypothetical protein [Chlorobiota bacterium]